MAPENFTEAENASYQEWLERKNRASISPALSIKFFELFLRGDSCDKIQSLNPGITLGQILEARVRDQWDRKREKYTEELYSGVADRFKQTVLESVEFTTDLLAAAHREHGQKLKKYIMSQDPADLGEVRITSFGAYAKVVDTLMKLTGQQKENTVRTIIMPENHEIPISGAAGRVAGDTTSVNSPTADRILKFLEEKNVVDAEIVDEKSKE